MKKTLILTLLTIFVSFLSIKSLILAKTYEPETKEYQEYTSKQHDTSTDEQEKPDGHNSYCEACCSAGRSVSSSCCKKCNNCQAYDDSGHAECHDVPN